MVSYGSTSNFDMEDMIAHNISALQKSYLKAQETNQRVNNVIFNSDHQQITTLDSVIKRLDNIFNLTETRLKKCVHDLHEVLEVVEERAHFHAKTALHKVWYMVHYNFKRYWMLQSERALDHLTAEFYPFGGSVERVIENICGDSNDSNSDVQTREFKWHPIENQLLNKMDLSTRVLGILPKINESYATAQPLGTYKVTDNRLYDKDFLAIELFQPKHKAQESYFRSALSHTQSMNHYLQRMLSVGRGCIQNGNYDKGDLAEYISSYEYRCKQFNYYLFLLNDKVISNPVDLIEETIARFEFLRQDLDKNHDMLEDIVRWLHDILTESNSGSWKNIKMFSSQAMDYFSNTSLMKAYLAELASSAVITESIQNVTRLLNDLLSRGKNFADGLQSVEKSFSALFFAMFGESTTQKFYSRIHNEVAKLLDDNSLASYYIPIYESLIDDKLEIQNYQELVTKMNADFVTLNSSLITENTTKVFQQFLKSSNVASIMGNAAAEFETAITDLQQNLFDFSEGNKISPAFFR